MSRHRSSISTGVIVGAIVVALIAAGGITILFVYPTKDKISFYIAVAAVVLSPIFVIAAYIINKNTEDPRRQPSGGDLVLQHPRITALPGN
jgi:lipopolysaccharide export LptBFGC system permease protein LptF